MNMPLAKSPAWTGNFLAFFFLAFGLLSFSDALSELQSQLNGGAASHWPALLSFMLALLFGAGWGLPLYLKKCDLPNRFVQPRNSIPMFLGAVFLNLFLLWILHPLRFQYHIFVASQMLFASGMLLRFSPQKQ